MLRNEIKKQLRRKIKELLDFEIENLSLESPEKEVHGDYATNIAMIISKQINRKPIEIAELIKKSLEKQDVFEKIEVVNPGFINFFISKKYLQEQAKQALNQGDSFGSLNIGKNKKVQVEFISANPTGPLTVGNARGGPFGNTLANILKKAGFKTEKAYYINDYGMQVLTLGHSVLKDKDAKYKGDYIDDLNKRIKEKDPYKVGQEAAKIIIKEIIKKTTDKLKIEYDEWVSENSFHNNGDVDKVLDFLRKKGLIYKDEGAEFFKSSNYGDKRDRVMIKSDGWKTYLASDIAHHKYKFEKKKFEKVINIWGADHHGDIAGLQAAVEAIGHKGKLDIILLQFVTVLLDGKEVRMSKRKGNYITMDQLLDEVGSDVVNFFLLQKSNNTHLKFDFSLAKEESKKNPVYYIQYAYARIHSILDKTKFKIKNPKFDLLNHNSELTLIKQLIRFPEMIEDIANNYQVQRLPAYVLDLATCFHGFYRDCKVLNEDKDLANARLGLILITKTVIKNSLDLMGISSPEKM